MFNNNNNDKKEIDQLPLLSLPLLLSSLSLLLFVGKFKLNFFTTSHWSF